MNQKVLLLKPTEAKAYRKISTRSQLQTNKIVDSSGIYVVFIAAIEK